MVRFRLDRRGGRDGGREGGMYVWREGGREGQPEGGREGGREGGMYRWREGGSQGEKGSQSSVLYLQPTCLPPYNQALDCVAPLGRVIRLRASDIPSLLCLHLEASAPPSGTFLQQVLSP